jgi:hypothetical protein
MVVESIVMSSRARHDPILAGGRKSAEGRLESRRDLVGGEHRGTEPWSSSRGCSGEVKVT